MNENETYEANIRVRDLPRATDTILNMLASMHSKLKWEIVRDALVEYAENHKHEIGRVASG